MEQWIFWVAGLFIAIVVYAYKMHEKRITDIEKTAVSKKDFTELKVEMAANFDKLMNGVNRLNDKVVTREVAHDISQNVALEAINKHQNGCPFVKAALNGNNQ